MYCRIILAAFFLGFVFAAAEADARSLSRGSSGANGRSASAPRSLQRFQQTPVVKGAPRGLTVTRQHHRRPFHRHAGHRWPFVFAAPYVASNDFVVPPMAFAQDGDVPPGYPVVINRRQCFVQPHTVPAEGTGIMRTVTVTRCY
ncbi:MAG: hypothetical protein K2Y71_04430 [Xanthobacteraceae bacterium]|nr:hypothetical protein [Xanthobacteraceae bacterium]